MLTALALLCLYLACLAFFHAAPGRTADVRIKESASIQRTLRISAWILAAVALVLAVLVSGFERGFPVWLGLFMLAGVASLLISALLPKWHVKSVYAVALACGLFGTLSTIGGAA